MGSLLSRVISLRIYLIKLESRYFCVSCLCTLSLQFIDSVAYSDEDKRDLIDRTRKTYIAVPFWFEKLAFFTSEDHKHYTFRSFQKVGHFCLLDLSLSGLVLNYTNK